MALRCPACGAGLSVPDAYAGSKGSCLACGAEVVAPGASSLPDASVAPPGPPLAADPQPPAAPPATATLPPRVSAFVGDQSVRGVDIAVLVAGVVLHLLAWQRGLEYLVITALSLPVSVLVYLDARRLGIGPVPDRRYLFFCPLRYAAGIFAIGPSPVLFFPTGEPIPPYLPVVGSFAMILFYLVVHRRTWLRGPADEPVEAITPEEQTKVDDLLWFAILWAAVGGITWLALWTGLLRALPSLRTPVPGWLGAAVQAASPIALVTRKLSALSLFLWCAAAVIVLTLIVAGATRHYPWLLAAAIPVLVLLRTTRSRRFRDHFRH